MIETDVLIIGSGGAGLRAAIESASRGLQTTIVSKGSVNRSGSSPMIGGDLMVDGKSLHDFGLNGNVDDSPQKWFRDMCIEGYYLNNQQLVQNYVSAAPLVVKEVLDWGIKVKRSEDREILTNGIEIVNAVYREFKRHNIEVFQDTMINDLLTNDNRIAGAIGVNLHTGELLTFNAKSIILATGGWMKAYSSKTIAGGMSGDGQAMAYRAGATLSNMEMVTFCPSVIIAPERFRGSLFLYVMNMFCGRLLTNSGTDILKQYNQTIDDIATKTEWNKLILCVFIAREIMKGNGTPKGGVYFSVNETNWEDVETVAKRIAPNWKFKGRDFREIKDILEKGDKIEVGPAAHYIEGGIQVNNRYETSIRGLFAAGECKSGTFGANRVGAASTEMLVEGYLSGINASEFAKQNELIPINQKQLEQHKMKIFKPLKLDEGKSPIQLRQKVQQLAYTKLGVIRNGVDLSSCFDEFQKMINKDIPLLSVESKQQNYNLEWLDALEVQNMLTVLKLSAKTALLRTESRGVHYRSDYPTIDHDTWLKEISVKSVGSNDVFNMSPVIVTSLNLPQGKFTFEDAIIEAVKNLNS